MSKLIDLRGALHKTYKKQVYITSYATSKNTMNKRNKHKHNKHTRHKDLSRGSVTPQRSPYVLVVVSCPLRAPPFSSTTKIEKMNPLRKPTKSKGNTNFRGPLHTRGGEARGNA